MRRSISAAMRLSYGRQCERGAGPISEEVGEGEAASSLPGVELFLENARGVAQLFVR